MQRVSIFVASALALTVAASASRPAWSGSEAAPAPDILLLGDSHLSFGAGRVFSDFFEHFTENCKSEENWPGEAASVATRSFALMGVKSTAIHTWVSDRWKLKKMVCVPDPKWPVNARLYGFPHRTDGDYVQFGKDNSFPFCRQRRESALEALFDWAKPNLMILYFMGNTIDRWANSPAIASQDVKRFMEQLPMETGCLVMTTSPVYLKSHNEKRVKAQANIESAFARHGERCTFLQMLTPQTIAAIEGNRHYFRRHRNGRVKDPYHPNIAAARRLVDIQRPRFCQAVMRSLRSNLVATVKD